MSIWLRRFVARSIHGSGRGAVTSTGPFLAGNLVATLCVLAMLTLSTPVVAQDLLPSDELLRRVEMPPSVVHSLDEAPQAASESETSTGVSVHVSDSELMYDSPLPMPVSPPLEPESAVVTPPSELEDADNLVDKLLANSMLDGLQFMVEASEAECSPCFQYEEYFYHGSGCWERNDWIVGSGDRMGVFSLPVTALRDWKPDALTFKPGGAIHFISGPKQTDLPPRVYELGYRVSKVGHLTDRLSYDVSCRVGWFTDFEGSVRDGLRLPSHGIAYFRHNECLQWLLGVDYLDRDDVRLLPVFGFLWTPSEDVRVEAVFPKPLIARRIKKNWFHIGAEMGGSTFDIKRAWGTKDVATYRDFRVYFAILDEEKPRSDTFEIGYVFGRHLQYRSGTPDFEPHDSVIVRSVFSY